MIDRYSRWLFRSIAPILVLGSLPLLTGCGDDPSRDAGQIDMATAKANSGAAADAGKVNPKAKVQSKSSGRARPDM